MKTAPIFLGIRAVQAGTDQANAIQQRPGGIAAVGGAALAAGVVGAVVSGPILAVGAAGAATYVAAARSDGVGDAARRVGNAAVGGLGAVRKFNEDHQVSQKLYQGTKQGLAQASEINQKHHVTETLGSAAQQSLQAAKKFGEDHHLKDRAAAAATTAAAASSAACTHAKRIDEKHQLTKTLGTTAESAWRQFSNAVEKNATKSEKR